MGDGVIADRNAEQIAYWNGPGGKHWTARQDVMDALLAPVSNALMDRAAVAPGERVIDVGCGCGATTLELTRRVGPSGQVLGLDISGPMLTQARERAPQNAPLSFVQADATAYRFNLAQADLLFSRFGVMFFADPAFSFANVRTALKPNGRLAFACWRDPRLNPWLLTALHAAYKHVPRLPDVAPDDPGPFSFASQDRVHRILGHAGFLSIRMEPADFALDLAVGQGLESAVETALEIGPASRALEGQPANLRDAARQSIREALAPFQAGQTVPLGAAVWFVTASNV